MQINSVFGVWAVDNLFSEGKACRIIHVWNMYFISRDYNRSLASMQAASV